MDDHVGAQPPVTPAPLGKGQSSVLLAVLSYFGPLIIVSYLLAKGDSFVLFHVRQAAVLLCVELALWVLTSFFWPLWILWQLVNLGVFVLAIIGIVHAVQGKETALPLVGQWAVHIPL